VKILELRFKNLNSLYGEWLIDFTEPEYVSDGIFALTGPTGAGKSTILDAICLALYGATPRLGRITSSSNEIMSRQTGECYAEVLFESQTGRFRCHWQQRRARKHADGKLQDQEHQITEADSGKIIESKKSLVGAIIEEKTGMDFERFTRSILLAQGGFDSFLKADAEQKSKILEQITGTQIYSTISRNVHERHRAEKDKLALLQARTDGIEVLSTDRITEIEAEIIALEELELQQAEKLAETETAIRWQEQIATLEQELAELTAQSEALTKDMSAFEPQRDILTLANKAVTVEGVYATLLALRQQQQHEQGSLQALEQSLPEAASQTQQLEAALKSAELATVSAKSALTEAVPLFKKVRALDLTLSEKSKAVLAETALCQQAQQAIAANQKDLSLGQQTQQQTNAALAALQNFFDKNTRDEWLISGLAGIEVELSQLSDQKKALAAQRQAYEVAKSALNKATKAQATCQAQQDKGQQALISANNSHQQATDALAELLGGKLLREYRAEKEACLREAALQTKIAELEDLRVKLQDGKPCPLCGADEHPYASGNIPAFDETEQRIQNLSALIDKAEDQEKKLLALSANSVAAEKQLQDASNSFTLAERDVANATLTLHEATSSVTTIEHTLAELQNSTLSKLAPLGVTDLTHEIQDTDALLRSLQKRLNNWRDNVQRQSQLKEQLTALAEETGRIQAIIDTQKNAYKDMQVRLVQLQSEHDALLHDRQDLFADASPDTEENTLNQDIATAEEKATKQRQLHAQQQQVLHALTTQQQALQSAIAQRQEDLLLAEENLVDQLTNKGFENESQFLAAQLSTEQRQALTEKAHQLDVQAADLKATQKDRAARLAIEQHKSVTEIPAEQLAESQLAYQTKLKSIREQLSNNHNAIARNIAALRKIAEQQASIETQKAELARWEKLHALIGSADGKKYRNFAQGLTFELMVAHANKQLEKMTDRYLLLRDITEPLSLNVLDNYQAGEIRSIKNLSGGESFIISLTLALGLSKMASQKVRVDSLFLDEGFGTLDEDALETALETLSRLQQEGKLIGVISHIPALKQRINTQISITPISGGKSSLAGPGCQSIPKTKA
jgi:exonuclease SbcC